MRVQINVLALTVLLVAGIHCKRNPKESGNLISTESDSSNKITKASESSDYASLKSGRSSCGCIPQKPNCDCDCEDEEIPQEPWLNPLCKPCPNLVPLYRYGLGVCGKLDHVFTTNYADLGAGKYGYRLQKTGVYIWTNLDTGRVALYGYFNAIINKHFYTTDFSLYGEEGNGYKLKGVVGYVYEAPKTGTLALSHFQNPATSDNVYTPDLTEYAGNTDYELIGITGYACPPPFP